MSRYEYLTREVPTTSFTSTSYVDDELFKERWHRVWADVTLEGTFIVYRRERKEFK